MASGTGQTLTAQLHRTIRDAILLGEFEPGDRLHVSSLAKRYAASTTVVREALTRLSMESIVRNSPQRGFFVQTLDQNELADLVRMRVHNDTFGLRLAIERGSLAWEGEVLTAHHTLSRIPRRGPENPDVTRLEWTDAHRAFHLALLHGSGIELVQNVAAIIFDSTELYRRWAARDFMPLHRDIDQEHEDILQATLDRDADRATELLALHYRHTHDVMAETTRCGERAQG